MLTLKSIARSESERWVHVRPWAAIVADSVAVGATAPAVPSDVVHMT